MNRVGRATSKIALAVALSMLFGGCIVVQARRHYVGEVVLATPPPARVEVYGVAPGPGYVWIGGYWNWVGGRHVWVNGRWEAPRPGYRYVAHRWVHERDGWHLQEGYWVRR